MWYSLKNHHISRDVGHFLVPQGAIHFSLETTSKTSIFIGGISTPVIVLHGSHVAQQGQTDLTLWQSILAIENPILKMLKNELYGMLHLTSVLMGNSAVVFNSVLIREWPIFGENQ